jgi:hypothetical protein
MDLKAFLEQYRQDKVFEVFKEKLKDMYAFTEKVEVIDWEPEFAVADYNPEVLDEMEFMEMLYKNGLITQREFERKLQSLPYSRRTEGVAFIDELKVSFRSKRPLLPVILHELGHLYFKENDAIWSASYGGGESVMWLILKGKINGNEETIRRWHRLMHMGYEEKEKLMKLLDKVALELAKELKLELMPYMRPVYAYFYYAGVIIDERTEPFGFLQNLIAGLEYDDVWCKVLFERVVRELALRVRLPPPALGKKRCRR